MIKIKTADEIMKMRKTCALASQTLDYLESKIEIGMSTEDINTLCHEYIISHGAYPSPLNYHGFPKSVCTSLNEVICHGIPSAKDIIKDGDILNIDVTCFLDGYHGDTNRTFLIGNVKPEVQKLVQVTYEAMIKGIKEVAPGKYLGDIGAAIEEYAHQNSFTVVHEYCGHGIGTEFHEDPQVLHFGRRGTGPQMREGMIFTIEPMINLGQRFCKVLKDEWTVVTKDKKPSAQFEHTVLVTSSGYEILTLSGKGY